MKSVAKRPNLGTLKKEDLGRACVSAFDAFQCLCSGMRARGTGGALSGLLSCSCGTLSLFLCGDVFCLPPSFTPCRVSCQRYSLEVMDLHSCIPPIMLSIQKNATVAAAETASSRFQIAQASRQHGPRAQRWQQWQKRFRTASKLCKRSSGPTFRFALLRSGTASYVRGEPSMYPRSSTARESTVAGIAAPFCARTRRSPSPTATGHRQVHCSSLCAARSGQPISESWCLRAMACASRGAENASVTETYGS